MAPPNKGTHEVVPLVMVLKVHLLLVCGYAADSIIKSVTDIKGRRLPNQQLETLCEVHWLGSTNVAVPGLLKQLETVARTVS